MWERDGEGEYRRPSFVHLPSRCGVRVYTMGGHHVVTLGHDSLVRGYCWWDLRNKEFHSNGSGPGPRAEGRAHLPFRATKRTVMKSGALKAPSWFVGVLSVSEALEGDWHCSAW